VLDQHACFSIATIAAGALREFLEGDLSGAIVNCILQELKQVQVVAGELLLKDGQKTANRRLANLQLIIGVDRFDYATGGRSTDTVGSAERKRVLNR
jgi:hypothetical protein